MATSARCPRGLLQFAKNYERVNAGWPAYEEALKKAGVQYTAHHHPGTNHGSHNDTTPRDDEAAAKLAWQRTHEFFNKEPVGKTGLEIEVPGIHSKLGAANPLR